MSAYSREFTVHDLSGLAPSWDKLMAADLIREVETDIADRVECVSEMRLFLAIKGYRQMHDVLTAETRGKTGVEALKAMALASRRYAKERPGLSAATFRRPMIESAEWIEAFIAVRRLFEDALAECGLENTAAVHALRILRSLVRGFVVNEMSGSFSGSEEFDDSFELAVEMFLSGLPILKQKSRSDEHCLGDFVQSSARDRKTHDGTPRIDTSNAGRVVADHFPKQMRLGGGILFATANNVPLKYKV